MSAFSSSSAKSYLKDTLPKFEVKKGSEFDVVLVEHRTPFTNAQWGNDRTNQKPYFYNNDPNAYQPEVPSTHTHLALALPLNVSYRCVALQDTVIYEGCDSTNKCWLQRQDYPREGLLVVLKSVQPQAGLPPRAEAVLVWQCVLFDPSLGISDISDQFPPEENFGNIWVFHRTEIDKQLEREERERRKERIRQREIKERAERAAKDAAKREKLAVKSMSVRKLDIRKNMEYDLMLLKATPYYNDNLPGNEPLVPVEPNKVYHVKVLKDVTLWENDAHPQVWVCRAGVGEESMLVQLRLQHPNLFQVNNNTGRQALIADLVWYTKGLDMSNTNMPVINLKPSSDIFQAISTYKLRF